MVLKNLMIPFTLINKRKHNSLKISDYPVFYRVDIRDVYDFALPDVFEFIDKNRIT